jgi:hypothetical protein
MNMKYVEAGNSGEMEKKKRGRRPKADPQTNHLMICLNDKDHKRFLQMYGHSRKRSMSAFIADCILNEPMEVAEINKSVIRD